MKRMNHVLLYGNYEDAFRHMPPEDVGELVVAMLHYLNTGEESELTGMGDILWTLIKDQIDRNIQKYEEVCKRNRRNAKKYWDNQKGQPADATGTQ